MEHNAVMRPLVQLQKQGVTFDRIPCDREGNLILSEADCARETKYKASRLSPRFQCMRNHHAA